MKRIIVSLDVGCYDMPSHGLLVNEIPVLFDNRDIYASYDEDLINMPVVGTLWHLDLRRVPSVRYREYNADLTLVGPGGVGHDVTEEALHEDEVGPVLRGHRKNICYRTEWKQRYEGLVEDWLCDGKLAGCFYWEYDVETNKVTGCRLVLKKGDYRRNGAFYNVRVIE